MPDSISARQFVQTTEEAQDSFPDGHLMVGSRLDSTGKFVRVTNGHLILCLPTVKLKPLPADEKFEEKIRKVTPKTDYEPTIRLSRRYLLRILETFEDSESLRFWITGREQAVVIKGDDDEGHAVLMPIRF